MSFSERFAHYLPSSDDMIRVAISSGLIILDTNVLLCAYRFAPEARNELITVLERVVDRVWIPDQVALEFHRNRLEVIGDQGAAYEQVIAKIDSYQGDISKDLQEQIRRLANRAALASADRDRLIGLVNRGLDEAKDAVQKLREKHGMLDILGDDAILARLEKILDGKVGQPFTLEERTAAEKEAERRIREQVPPGYKDADKPYPYGDYFLWKQTLNEVAARQAKDLVFVTSDTKEDWYKIVKGRVIGPRPELAQEVATVTDCRLVMLNTDRFLRKAREHLGASVSSETIRQAESLPMRSGRAGLLQERLDITRTLQERTRDELGHVDVELLHKCEALRVLEDSQLTLITPSGEYADPERLRVEAADMRSRVRHLEARRHQLLDRVNVLTMDLDALTHELHDA